MTRRVPWEGEEAAAAGDTASLMRRPESPSQTKMDPLGEGLRSLWI